MNYDGIVIDIVNRYRRAAYYLNIEIQELRSTACIAVLESKKSWDPDRGRSETNWAWLCADYAIKRLLDNIEVFEDYDINEYLATTDVEHQYQIRELLNVLGAELHPQKMALLVDRYVFGLNRSELAAKYGVCKRTISNWFYEIKKSSSNFCEIYG